MSKIIISFSGGLDSTTMIAYALECGHVIVPVTFRYSAKNNLWERRAASDVLRYYSLTDQHMVVDCHDVFKCFVSSFLAGQDTIPKGHHDSDEMRKMVIPARNMIFVSILTGLAQSLECKEVWIGVHLGGMRNYPDTRPEFVGAIALAAFHGTDGRVRVYAPFGDLERHEIIRMANDLGVPLGLTRSCYEDQEQACGKCGACSSRKSAFAAANTEDQIFYAPEDQDG